MLRACSPVKTLYLSFFFNPNLYLDRLQLIDDSLPQVWRGIVLCWSPIQQNSNFKKLRILCIKKSFWPIGRTPFIQVLLLLIVIRLLRRRNLIIQDWSSSFILPALIFRRSVNVIYSPVTSALLWFKGRLAGNIPFLGARADFRRAKELLFELPMLIFSRWVIVQSISLQDDYLKLLHNIKRGRIFASYNSIAPFDHNLNIFNIATAQPENGDRQFCIGFVGNIERQKGSVDLIRLRKMLNVNRFKFVLAGTANGYQNKKILNQLKMMEGVDYRGRLSRDELIRVYSEIDCLILPSYHEGSPRVVAEFYNTGKEIVSYLHPGLDYCVGINGISLVPIGDIDSFAEKLTDLTGLISERSKNCLVDTYSLRNALSIISNFQADS